MSTTRLLTGLMLLFLLGACSEPRTEQVWVTINNRLDALERSIKDREPSILTGHLNYINGVHTWQIIGGGYGQERYNFMNEFMNESQLIAFVEGELEAVSLIFIDRTLHKYQIESMMSGTFVLEDRDGDHLQGEYDAFFLRSADWRMHHLILRFD